MTTKKSIIAGLTVVLLAAAAISSANTGHPQQNVAPAAAKTSAASAPVPLVAAGTKVVTITDPVFNMTAYSLTIPENWIFQGSAVDGTSCASAPLPVFRMSAPDGLTGVKWFPRLDWAWPDDAKSPAALASSDCLPVKNVISASDFLKNMIGILNVSYVKSLPTPNLAALQKSVAANNTALITTVADAANFQVRYHIHQIEIEEHVNAVVFCSTDKTFAKSIQHSCSANLARSWAPQGKWSDETFAFTQHSLVMDQKWSAELYWYSHRTAEDIRKERLPSLDEGRDRRDRARFNALLQSEALRKKQYQEFLVSMHPGTELITATPARPAASDPRMPDDWCDYALDKEKISSHLIGDTSKDPADFNYSWINGKGERLQTKNLNDNPNGNNTGAWTLELIGH
jgi:hypothetical protein